MTRPLTPPEGTTRIGHLLGPHGVQGGVKLFVLGDPAQLLDLKRVYLESRGWLRLLKVEPSPPGVIFKLAGITTREAAESLRTLNVYAADPELPPLEEGHYYYHDLRGLKVVDATGETLGAVLDVEDAGHQDLLVVQHDSGTSYVPLQAPYVVVELAGRKPGLLRLTGDAPEGLIGPEPSEPQED